MSFSDFLEVLLRQLQFVKLNVLIINYSRKNIAIISPSDSYDNFLTPIFINFLLNQATSLFLPFFCTYFLPLCFVPQVTIWLVTHPMFVSMVTCFDIPKVSHSRMFFNKPQSWSCSPLLCWQSCRAAGANGYMGFVLGTLLTYEKSVDLETKLRSKNFSQKPHVTH